MHLHPTLQTNPATHTNTRTLAVYSTTRTKDTKAMNKTQAKSCVEYWTSSFVHMLWSAFCETHERWIKTRRRDFPSHPVVHHSREGGERMTHRQLCIWVTVRFPCTRAKVFCWLLNVQELFTYEINFEKWREIFFGVKVRGPKKSCMARGPDHGLVGPPLKPPLPAL